MSNNPLEQARRAIRSRATAAEAEIIDRLLAADRRDAATIDQARRDALALIGRCREHREDRSLLDAFLAQFGLSTEEGVALMCLAESIVRVPDADTVDDLIADKLGSTRWREHLGQSDSLLVNASTWALMLTGEVVSLARPLRENFSGWFGQLVNRLGEPVIRQSLRYAMQLLGNEFVFAETARDAVDKAVDGQLYSFDMLGEAARTEADARRYFDAYQSAIEQLGTSTRPADCLQASGISVKLSALYARYDGRHERAVHQVLYPRLRALAEQAAGINVQLTVDAEEAHRLALSLDLIARLAAEPALAHWQGLGLAVQAYGRRALHVLDFLEALAARTDRRLLVRLVKGAYWDTEIKRAQVLGLPSYPVFTTKPATDLSYLACAARLLARRDRFYPQFATHNAYTLTNLLALADDAPFELQRLHGMGELVYAQAAEQFPALPPVRTYAPVGPHRHLMAYLIRRLLENGANSSFVNRFLDETVPAERLVHNTRELVIEKTSPLPEPRRLYGAARPNSPGLDLDEPGTLAELQDLLGTFSGIQWGSGERPVHNPARPDDLVGRVTALPSADIPALVDRAQDAQPAWERTGAAARALVLRKIGDTLGVHRGELLALLIREAGKTWEDALAEVREAQDFCYYYATECERLFLAPTTLPGPTGEANTLELCARGVFACISPWNFPLAIFTGQITAALAAGNAVIAKPAEQTPLIAARAVALMHQSGVPQAVLQLAVGAGELGAALVAAPGLGGVAFTGGTDTARHIARSLADKPGPLIPLIAETGGQNAMIVDSTAMLEQVVDDVVRSGFGSAGQRCSALRVLCVQEDIAEELLTMLSGAMDLLQLGDPWHPATDVGPIIDAEAAARLTRHIDQHQDRHLAAAPLPAGLNGHFIAPTLLRIERISELTAEHFGPIVHWLTFARQDLNALLADIEATGYGLTLGIHSRSDAFVDAVYAGSRAGNVYVNRNMIGAVVGVQPFGGTGLSGTGPKAGGPHTLLHFATELTLTRNLTAVGGDLALLTDGERTAT